jgi:hypothetical protein
MPANKEVLRRRREDNDDRDLKVKVEENQQGTPGGTNGIITF